ncbi:DNA polymerase III subunit gamma/tau [Candidatus Poribacteria bacterium]|nr:DNA polymerase III subunit gamma/tau [Candidatus Poribacteria bacterium]
MSYEVFAQKWRPQYFQDVVGQAHVTATLQNQIRSERLGHAYLFWGPRGTGKTTVARLFAKAVNCLKPSQETDLGIVKTGEPCNDCDACREITQGSSFDVIEMDAASNRGIDTIRDLRENVKLSPAAYKYKIYIIDEVHMLTPEGFNALLKTLEEPPAHVIFIMATTEHSQIPKTIISRCQDFDFRHLVPEQITSRLQLIVDDEGISADSEVLSLIARQSEGCLRDAENLLERLYSSVGKELTLDNVEETLGLSSSNLLYELTEAIAGRNLGTGLAALNQLSIQGMDLAQCLHQIIGYFRDLRLLAIDNNLEDLVQSPKSELSDLKEKAEQISVERLSRIIKILMHTNREIKEYGYAQLHLESALIQINSIKETIQLDEIVNKLIAIEQKIANSEMESGTTSTPILPIIPNTKPTESIMDVESPTLSMQESEFDKGTSDAETDETQPKILRSLDELSDIWEEVMSQLKETSPQLAFGTFKGANPIRDGEDRIKIVCAHDASLSFVDDDARKNIINKLSEIIGKPIQIELVKAEVDTQTDEITAAPEKEVKTTPMMRKRQAEEDEQIQPVLDLFDASILEIQI